MMGSLYTIVLVAQTAAGGLLHHDRGPGCCADCGAETVKIWREIARLQTCPKWRARDDAAHALRRFDWRCHPEIVAALAAALLRDCEEEVREEAAESLAKLAPCVPTAHEALRKAAVCDPDHATRKWARRALARLQRRCVGDCRICSPIADDVPIPVPVGEPILVPGPEPIRVPGPEPVIPSFEVPTDSPPVEVLPPLPPPLPSGNSPFVLPPAATRPRAPALAAGRRPASVLFQVGRRPPASDH